MNFYIFQLKVIIIWKILIDVKNFLMFELILWKSQLNPDSVYKIVICWIRIWPKMDRIRNRVSQCQYRTIYHASKTYVGIDIELDTGMVSPILIFWFRHKSRYLMYCTYSSQNWYNLIRLSPITDQFDCAHLCNQTYQYAAGTVQGYCCVRYL